MIFARHPSHADTTRVARALEAFARRERGGVDRLLTIVAALRRGHLRRARAIAREIPDLIARAPEHAATMLLTDHPEEYL